MERSQFRTSTRTNTLRCDFAQPNDSNYYQRAESIRFERPTSLFRMFLNNVTEPTESATDNSTNSLISANAESPTFT